MKFGEMSKVANAIRRAIAKAFNVKPGKVNFKLCCAVAKKGGNEITTVNAMNYNSEFRTIMLLIKKKPMKVFRYFVGAFSSMVIGESRRSVIKSLLNQHRGQYFTDIRVEQVLV